MDFAIVTFLLCMAGLVGAYGLMLIDDKFFGGKLF